jgi:hypothetical protein
MQVRTDRGHGEHQWHERIPGRALRGRTPAARRRVLARPAHRPPESLGGLGTPVEHATFETLHTASLAAPRCGPA